ncbi:transmembrane protein 218 [Neoarius graeffei]|uniref:transmembrane protein 218 n=1 Tax=Neoarius graeffei TaxID=443677 RepID=UPI00298CC2D0|nr:transmembrane protein 218 [Neoarius graeffei]XP_060765282.1 transmembrane protein 218 [Neoarius graeffei]XP_060765283.1 transmembrane protein 218 [Neoarius graeffei]
MSGALVLGVGTGVFLVALMWIGTLVLSLIMSHAAGPIKLGIIPLVLLALTITLTLVFFPRASELPSAIKETQIVDTFFISRYVLLAVVSVVFLVSLFIFLPFHLLESVYAKPLRAH